MTVGEKNIIVVTLYALQNNDLISQEALNEVIKELKLPGHKEIRKEDDFSFINEIQCTQRNFTESNGLRDE